MPTYIHLVRHAQGFHNSTGNHQIRDPDLTPLGEEQCARLQAEFPLLPQITHLVASPLRRTLHTCLLSFRPALQNAAVSNTVTAVPGLQEISTMPCDVGSSRAALAAEFGGRVDLRLVDDAWTDKASAASPYAPDMRKLEARARAARVWLRELGRAFEAAHPGVDAHIVAVTHGGFLHFLTQDWDGMNPRSGTGWANAEWRTYGFVEGPEGEGEGEARLREREVSWRRRRGSETGLSETEQMELRSAVGLGLETERRKWDAMNGKGE
ncbi:phosphoglycerate mutase-like protein [Trichocladium antarcticum]|uniref:Phosphoglycerate mutase-like protein n=1 Tax=Trichocladium antarcticum TaxID=1450529 RepID=A0AAN6ULJ7_9PEZI|nr:phosphoglycerate mutase-like protein [Trichocladium antarcticum]